MDTRTLTTQNTIKRALHSYILSSVAENLNYFWETKLMCLDVAIAPAKHQVYNEFEIRLSCRVSNIEQFSKIYRTRGE